MGGRRSGARSEAQSCFGMRKGCEVMLSAEEKQRQVLYRALGAEGVQDAGGSISTDSFLFLKPAPSHVNADITALDSGSNKNHAGTSTFPPSRGGHCCGGVTQLT